MCPHPLCVKPVLGPERHQPKAATIQNRSETPVCFSQYPQRPQRSRKVPLHEGFGGKWHGAPPPGFWVSRNQQALPCPSSFTPATPAWHPSQKATHLYQADIPLRFPRAGLGTLTEAQAVPEVRGGSWAREEGAAKPSHAKQQEGRSTHTWEG